MIACHEMKEASRGYPEKLEEGNALNGTDSANGRLEMTVPKRSPSRGRILYVFDIKIKNKDYGSRNANYW